MEPSSSPWNPANLLVTTDYDFTCTEEESCELLIRAKETAMEITDCRIMKAYLGIWDEYEQVLEEHMADLEGESPLQEHMAADNLEGEAESDSGSSDLVRGDSASLDTTALRKALSRLAGLELAINGKAMAAGLLKGLSRAAIRSAGKQIALQPGCLQVLLRFASLGAPIHVISANWSRDLVYGGLSTIPEHLLFVHCNDLEFDSNGASTGWFHNAVTNAVDKEKVLQALRTTTTGQKRMVVYLGDDQPDTLALLDADLGIVMGATDALCILLRQNRIQLRPLRDASTLLANGTVSTFRQTGILFQASSWDDVNACFFGRN